MSTSRISKITIGRLYNLGNYEHVRYELTVDVPECESASAAVIAVEKILKGLSPLRNASIKSAADIVRDKNAVAEMRTKPVVDWERRYGHHAGTAVEVIARHEKQVEEDIEKRENALALAKRARELFDDLGGAAQWKDAKLDWEDDDEY